MAYSKRWLVGMLRQLGYTQEADDASREMPAEFDLTQLQAFGDRHGISRGELIDRMGGSP